MNLSQEIASLSPKQREILWKRLIDGDSHSVANPIICQARDGALPLSYAQHRLWFLDQLEPNNPFYNIFGAVRLSGPLDGDALRRTLSEIVRRHEVLRTTFPAVDGQPRQVIAPARPVDLPLVDLTNLAEAAREAEVRRLAEAEARRPFDLARDPLLRASLLHLQPDEHVLMLAMHHIVADAWSMSVLTRELGLLYEAYRNGRPSPLPELPIQYADVACWQRQTLEHEALDRQLAYWRDHLQGAPAVLALPTDRPRPAMQSHRGARLRFELPVRFSQALKAISKAHGVTLYMTLLAAFQTLLHRYSGQTDIVVGSPIAGRTRSETEALIGLFINTLVLRIDLADDPPFDQLLARVRDVALGAYAHQDLPFEKLVEDLQPERSLSHAPLFQVMFTLQNAPRETFVLSDLTLSELKLENQTAKFDLSLEMAESERGLVGVLEYNSDLWEEATIARMVGHLQTLLDAIIDNPGQRLSQLELLPRAEREQLLFAWNDTQVAYPDDLCLHQLFEAQVARTPDAPAIVFDTRQLTYRQLDRRANQLAHRLQTLGVGPEVPVGLYLERSIDMIVAILAVLKAGGAYLPLDPSHPDERIALMLNEVRVPIVLSDRPPAPTFQGPRWIFPGPEATPLEQAHVNSPVSSVNASNLAYIIYTSGSTGRPKGVGISHGNVVNFLVYMRHRLGLTDRDALLAVTTLSFDIAVLELFLPLVTGAHVAIVGREVAQDGARLSKAITDSGATLMQATPATWRMLLESDWPAQQRLRVLCGGDVLPRSLASELIEKSGGPIWNMYGPTETTIWSTIHEVTSGSGQVSLGYAIANTRVYLLDRHLQPVPLGVVGDLYIAGAGLGRGYLNLPGLTAEKFIPDPFSIEPGARLYRTGDLGVRRDGGTLEFLGRVDNQVKLRGYRVELGEIEAVLDSHPAVQQCVVTTSETQPGDKRLVAFMLFCSQPVPSAAALRRFLSERLPDYMVPSVFVPLEQLPLTRHGKVDRSALPVPEQVQPALSAVTAPPRTPTEAALVDLWAELVRRTTVGIHDNFFELGGHSLLATQLVSRIRSLFGIELILRTLFENPTVAALAVQVDGALRAQVGPPSRPIEPVPRDGALPLSYAQHRLWFLDQLEPNNPFYNIFGAVRLSGPLDGDALRRTLSEIVRRHEVLRTTFPAVDGQPRQVIAPARPVDLPLVDLTNLAEAAREAEVRRLAEAEARRPFDLARDPLLRASLLHLQPDEHVLMLAMHHIVADAWSMSVLTRELGLLYEAYRNGRPSPLPELPIQYADVACWQRQTLEHEALDRQLAYWRDHLQGAPAVLALPTDRPRPAMQSHRGARLRFELPVRFSQALKAISKAHGVTLYMTLLAAFQTLLHRYSGQTDIVVGSPIAGRTRSETEALIGLFINTLVLRIDLADDPPFDQLLARVRDVALGAYAHQDLPFEKLVEDLQPERSLSHAPLFQVMFTLQNAPRETFVLSDLTLSELKLENQTAKFDLSLEMAESERGLVGVLEYNSDLWEEATIARMVGHLQTLLDAIIDNPGQRLSQLELLPRAEREQLLFAWNDTQVAYPDDLCLHQLFEAQVARTPDAPAIVFDTRQLTYRQLDRRANQLAHRLQTLGVGPEVPVGLYLERSIDMIVAILAVLKAGGAYLPLDPSHPDERIALMLNEVRVPIVLSDRPPAPTFQGPRWIFPGPEATPLEQAHVNSPVSSVNASNLAVIASTIGPTGQPIGLMVAHRALSNRLLSMQKAGPLTEEDAVLQVTPFDAPGSIRELFWPLLAGAHLVLIDPEARQNKAVLVRAMESRSISTVSLEPLALGALLEQMHEKTSQHLTRCLKRIICTGAPLAAELQRRFFARFPHTRLFYFHGSDQAVGDVVGSERKLSSDVAEMGLPRDNVRIYLLDRYLQPVPIGVRGRMFVGGVQVSRGYLNRPALTAARFIPDPFSDEPGTRLYQMEDRARWLASGEIEILPSLGVDLTSPPPALSEPSSEQGDGEARPREPLEEILLGIWSEVLGRDEIGVHENFFELGGHSLLAVQIMGRLQGALQLEMPLRSLFEHPTIAGLARIARSQMAHPGQPGAAALSIRPVPRDGPLPLSFNQQRLWFLDQLVPGNSFYNSCSTVQLFGALNIEALQQALSDILRRHEVLRTTFPAVDGQPHQLIAAAQPLPLPLLDLTALPSAGREDEARRLATEAWRTPFNLAHGPLLRVQLLRLDAEAHVLLLSMHHIVGDAWSMSVLTRELQTLYAHHADPRQTDAPALPALPIQYADYAAWQHRWLRGEVLEAHLTYWKRQLQGSPARLALPTDHARPPVQSFHGSFLTFDLPGTLSRQLVALSRQEGVTLFMALLAAFQALLCRYCGQEDIVVGVGVANRTRVETEPLIGCFVNMLVLRTDLSGSPTFRQLLRRVREVTLGAYAHQEMPFDKLVEALQPERDLSHMPLFQVAFGVDNAPKQQLALAGLNQSALPFDYESVRYDLTLWVVEKPSGLQAHWTYSTSLFEPDTIARMHAHYEILLLNASENPDVRVNAIDIRTEREKEVRTNTKSALRAENLRDLMRLAPRAIRPLEDGPSERGS